MNQFWKWIKALIMSTFFEFIEKKKEYDVGRIRALVRFKNGKEAELTIVGKTEVFRESFNREGSYVLEYAINSAKDIFHRFLEDIEAGLVDFIVGDDRVYYRLSENVVDEIKLMETASNKVYKTIYERVKKNG